MTPATLTGAVPGLVTRGCSVIVEQESADCNPCLVLSVHEKGLCTVNRFGGSMSPISPSRVALVLDEAGMDRAARFLAGRVGLTVGATAPYWMKERAPAHRPPSWRLGSWEADVSWQFTDDADFASMFDFRATHVPGISALTDPSTALALAIQALASLALPGGA